jgi:oxygen-independent coproporphyrinogen III oxidase
MHNADKQRGYTARAPLRPGADLSWRCKRHTRGNDDQPYNDDYPMDTFSLYIHFPFCTSRCAYCDFFSTAGCEDRIPYYWDSIRRELEMVGETGDRPELVTIYFGGGTPSLARSSDIARTMDSLRSSYRLPADAEVTLEANPGTVQESSLADFRAAGVNRISLGIQSADDRELRMMGRPHSWEDAAGTVADARLAGFDNVSLDLIFGLPGQNISVWRRSLEQILALDPEHVSLYALTLDRGTRIACAVQRGELPAPDDDLTADMYRLAEEVLAAAGYRHYEISNWAKDTALPERREFPFFASRHNLQYWLNLPYLGIGAGAHGSAAGYRYSNRRSVEEYIQRIQDGKLRRFPLSAAATVSHKRTRMEEMRETVWLGLRLVEAGVSDGEYRRRFGMGLREAFPQEIEKLVSQGLIEWAAESDRLRLTPSARFISNIVFREFV